MPRAHRRIHHPSVSGAVSADSSSPKAARPPTHSVVAPGPRRLAPARKFWPHGSIGHNEDWLRKLSSTHTHEMHHRVLSVLGLKGTMSEAELHIIRARLEGGIRNKAWRGELRRGLLVGLVWGDEVGEVRFHSDEAVTGAIRTVFDRFSELGSARQVWLWFRT